MSSKAQVLSNNTNSFPNNNSGQITPQVLRDFNADFINSVVFLDQTGSLLVASASFASTAISASQAQNAVTAAFALNAPTVNTGSFVTTSSFNAFSSSISGRVESLEQFSSSLDANFASQAELDAVTASLNALSSSYIATSGSVNQLLAFSSSLDATFATDAQLNAYTASTNTFTQSIQTQVNSLQAATASYVNASVTGSSIVTASANVNIITFTKGNGTTFDVTVAVSGSVATASYAATALSASFSQTAISSSYALSSISASYAVNSTSASYAVNSTSASYAVNSTSASYAANSTSASYASQAQNAVSSSFASTATSASFASTIASGLNITASNILVTNDLVVNGTASFGYTKTTSGSAVIIGDEFIILNADTPTAPFAGIKVYDTGSASTASFEWNGNGDYWIAVEETGQSAAFLTGASGSKGLEVFPSSNRLIKGTGNNTVVDSNITDNGTSVSINSNTLVTGSLNVTAGITGSLLGTASFATSASYALNATSASYAVNSTSASYATTSLSASYASASTNAQNASDILVYAKNSTGAQIDKGKIVLITGAVGDNPLIGLADYSSEATSVGTLGFVTADIPNDNFGYVMTEGTFIGLDTLGYTAGQLVFLGASGSITGSMPIPPLQSVRVGEILRVQSNNGSIYARIDNGYELEELHNVVYSGSLVDGQALIVSGGLWTNGNPTSASFASTSTSASFAQTAISASYAPSSAAFPFTGSADISGSLTLVGDQYITGSIIVRPTTVTGAQPFTVTEVTDGIGFEGNLIMFRNNNTGQTGSVNISGSTNIFIPSVGVSNTSIAGGAAAGFQGRSSIVTTAAIVITGSLGTGYNRQYPAMANSIVNAGITITDNRPVGTTTTPLTLSGTSINSTTTLTISTGSITLGNNNLIGTGTAINVTGSNGASKVISNSLLGVSTINIDSTSGTNLSNAVILGTGVSVLISGSTNTTLQNVLAVGNTLSVTGSTAAAAQLGSAYVGRFNDTGSTALVTNTAFAVGTGTSASARKTSLHVSSSGLLTLTDGLIVTGSLLTSGSVDINGGLTVGGNIGVVVSSGSTITTPIVRASTIGGLSIYASDNTTVAVLGSGVSPNFTNRFLYDVVVTGSVVSTVGFTGSLAGTASFATSASFASTVISSSFASTSTSASFASSTTSASFAQTAISASYAPSSFDANALYSYTFLLMGA